MNGWMESTGQYCGAQLLTYLRVHLIWEHLSLLNSWDWNFKSQVGCSSRSLIIWLAHNFIFWTILTSLLYRSARIGHNKFIPFSNYERKMKLSESVTIPRKQQASNLFVPIPFKRFEYGDLEKSQYETYTLKNIPTDPNSSTFRINVPYYRGGRGKRRAVCSV